MTLESRDLDEILHAIRDTSASCEDRVEALTTSPVDLPPEFLGSFVEDLKYGSHNTCCFLLRYRALEALANQHDLAAAEFLLPLVKIGWAREVVLESFGEAGEQWIPEQVDHLIGLIVDMLIEEEAYEWSMAESMAVIKALGDSATSSLVEMLGSEDAERVWAAHWMLREIGTPAVDALDDGTGIDDVGLNRWVLLTLAGIADPKSVQVLTGALVHDDPDVRWAAASALGLIVNGVGEESLLPLLDDEDVRVREAAATALGAMGSSSAVESIIDMLDDEYSTSRLAATEALGRLGDDRAVKPLMALLEDQERTVRIAAARALGEIGHPAGVKPLVGILGSPDGTLRWTAARSLASIGKPALAPLLAAMAKGKPDERECTAWTLGEIGDPAAVPLLVSVLSSKIPSLVGASIDALVKIGAPAVQKCTKALGSLNPRVRAAAAEVLGRIGGPAAVDILASALEDKDAGVREQAARALGHIDDVKAIPPLVDAGKRCRESEEKSTGVCVEVLLALGRIGKNPTEREHPGSRYDYPVEDFLVHVLEDRYLPDPEEDHHEWGDSEVAAASRALGMLYPVLEFTGYDVFDHCLKHETGKVWTACAKTRQEMQGGGPLPLLEKLVDPEDIWEDKHTAALLLASMGEVAAPALVQAMLNDSCIMDADDVASAGDRKCPQSLASLMGLIEIGEPGIPAIIDAIEECHRKDPSFYPCHDYGVSPEPYCVMDAYQTLAIITGVDLGEDPFDWRTWWNLVKENEDDLQQ
jgi:HEAT repeat protein